jgi:glycopeptide antibiotics resistance protein
MWQAFTAQSPYTRAARWAAGLWTLLIFILCLWPGQELPQVDVPFVDKWTHFVMFAVFSFCWLCAYPSARPRPMLTTLAASVLLGWNIEILQRWLAFLGRYYDVKDIWANALGGLLGVLLFWMLNRIAVRKTAVNTKQ